MCYISAGVDAKSVFTETRLEKQASDPPAVLLSPPCQRDSRAPSAGECDEECMRNLVNLLPCLCLLLQLK